MSHDDAGLLRCIAMHGTSGLKGQTHQRLLHVSTADWLKTTVQMLAYHKD
jgi:hypothetical protein